MTVRGPNGGPPARGQVALSTALMLALALGAWWLILSDRGTQLQRASPWVIGVSASLMLLLVAAAAAAAVWDARRR